MRQRVLRNTVLDITETFRSGETPVDVTGSVTVDVTRADGTALATGASTTHGPANSGAYTYTLTSQANLDVLTLKWTGTFGGVVQSLYSEIEVVGGYWVTLGEIRDADPSLADTAKYPTADLVAARQWFEDLAENFIGLAFVPRYGFDTLDGNGTSMDLTLLRYPASSLVEVLYDGVAQSLTPFDLYPSGRLHGTTAFPLGQRNIGIGYVHGLPAPTADLHDAALEAIAWKLMSKFSSISERASATTAGGTTETLTTAGDEHPTGLPGVDAALVAARGRERVPSIG